MHYNPRIHYTYGGELYHYRTVGSRNGYSKYSWYHPMGRKAIGRRLPNGTYEYTDTDTGTSQKNLEFRKMMRTSDENRLRKGNLQREADIRNAAQTREQKRLNQDKVNRQSKNLQNKLVSTTRDARLSRGVAQREADMRVANQQREQQRINKANNSLSGRIKNATNVVGTVASKAKKNAGNWLTERFGDAKTAVGNAARSVRDNIGNAAKNARDTVANAARNAYNAVGNAWDGKAGKGTAKDDAAVYRMYANRPSTYEELTNEWKKEKERHGYDSPKWWYNQIAKRKDEKYDRSIKGRMESAGNWLKERFGEAKDAVSDAARNAYNAVSNQDERKAYEKARDDLKKYKGTKYEKEVRDDYNKAKSAYQNHALTKAGRAIKDTTNSVGLAARNLFTNAKNAATRVGNAAKTARDLAGDVAYDVQFGVEDLKNKATQKALSVVDSTGKVVANTYNNLTGAEARKQSKIASDVVRKEEAQAKLLRKQGKTDDAVELEKQIATHKEAVKYWNKQASKSAISKATTRVGEAANNLRTGAQSFVEDITGTTRKKRNRRGYGGNSNQRQSR